LRLGASPRQAAAGDRGAARAQAPEYLLERDPNADEHGSTCLLRFTAGPPYEDVYFKILNKEWGAPVPPSLRMSACSAHVRLMPRCLQSARISPKQSQPSSVLVILPMLGRWSAISGPLHWQLGVDVS
jgi:hypothetical protein